MKILVIEDSVRLADTIAEALQNENYAVDIANDGQIGYEHASTGIYDMIILGGEVHETYYGFTC